MLFVSLNLIPVSLDIDLVLLDHDAVEIFAVQSFCVIVSFVFVVNCLFPIDFHLVHFVITGANVQGLHFVDGISRIVKPIEVLRY